MFNFLLNIYYITLLYCITRITDSSGGGGGVSLQQEGGASDAVRLGTKSSNLARGLQSQQPQVVAHAHCADGLCQRAACPARLPQPVAVSRIR